jgi:hypothetical protein
MEAKDKKFLTAKDCSFEMDRKCIPPERLKEIECIFQGIKRKEKTFPKPSRTFIEASQNDDQ